MASRRMIASDIWRDEFIGGLDITGRMLWIGLVVTCADDQGRVMDNSKLIRSDIFPFDDIPVSEIDGQLTSFAMAGKILRYEAEGKRLIQIVNWWEYQTPSWASASKYPAPTGWVDREKYHGVGNKIVINNWDKKGGIEQLPSRLPSQLHRPINEGDVKGDVKGEGDEEGEGSEPQTASAPDPFDAIQQTVESKGIILAGEADILTITELVNIGATPEDVLAGIEWKAANNNGKAIRYISALIGPTKTAMAKRLQAGPGHTGKEFAAGEGGRVSL